MENKQSLYTPIPEPVKENEANASAASVGNKIARRVSLPTARGFIIVEVDEIISLNSHYNSTFFNLIDGRKIMVPKTIKDYADILDPKAFFRAHKSSMIHLKYIKEFSRMDKNWAVMIDNNAIAISRRRLAEFIVALDKYNSTAHTEPI